jgi:hemolysin activation/secretion protein
VIVGILVTLIMCFCLPLNMAAATESSSLSMPAPTNNPPSSPSASSSANPNASPSVQNERHFYIQEYRVLGGGHLLPPVEIEAAVYPYLGPYRTTMDIENARGALEQAYRDKGYQTVSVQIPQQHGNGRIIMLQVVGGEVARLRVHGSRYFSLDQIKNEAPSLQEGQSPNFSQVTHDLLVLNGLPDRRVTPTVTAGAAPGTVNVDLNVKDTLPLHGSLEINNRYSADSTQLRINGSVNYDNLWQLGHSIGFSFQVSPEDLTEVKVFSGYYLVRFPDLDWLTFMVSGTKQDGDVNTLGGIGVVGKGDIVTGNLNFAFPGEKNFYHSFSLGLSYKHYTDLDSTPAQDKAASAANIIFAPITYFPVSAAYSATWADKGYETDLNASLNFALRGTGADETDFNNQTSGAHGNFFYLRGDLSHTRDLPGGFQFFVKGQGQAADQPLIPDEEFSGGGLGTVRGYLESEALGDNGIIGTTEIRSPSLSPDLGKSVDEWRFYLFTDAGLLGRNEPLPEEQSTFKLASVGVGSRIKLAGHINGSLDVGLPLDNGPDTNAYETQLTFRLWAEF